MKQTALVIESQALARTSLSEFLRDEGYEVTEAPNGFVAMRLIKDIPFGVVLTEFTLPEARGIMMLQRLRESTPNSRLIVMAHEPIAETQTAIRELGAQYVQKPILFDDLLGILSGG